MIDSLKIYIDEVKSSLISNLCHIPYPTQISSDRYSIEIEERENPLLILDSIKIVRNQREYALIERSINSTRVSFKIKQLDASERVVCDKYMRILMSEVDYIPILRKKAIDGYDISFLITDKHRRAESINFIVNFLTNVDSQISSLKLEINSRNRAIASKLLS